MMYRELIGSLLYLVYTILDICYAVSSLRYFMSNLRHVHWFSFKHVIRYLHGIVGYGLRYTSIRGVRLFSYIDSDWPNSAVD